MPYRIPKNTERKNALMGTSETCRSSYRKEFSSGTRRFFSFFYKVKASPFFKEINNSDPSDWLLNHKESGQTYEDFRGHRFASGIEWMHAEVEIGSKFKKKTIYILPLGAFPSCDDDGKHLSNPLLSWLESYCSVFFSTTRVATLPAVPLGDVACEYRVNEFTGRFQLNATDILNYLRQRKTRNQDCLIAVTMFDLFPKPSWNFVFGLASTSKSNVGGVGVFSFCRYDDRFYETWSLNQDEVRRNRDGTLDYSVFAAPPTISSDLPKIDGTLLLRACKVMTHEVCHMFGLKHCIWMQCLMNGSNHLEESDRRPPYLCPVCLRKLHSVLGFNVLERYNAMFEWTSGAYFETRSIQPRSRIKGSLSDTESSHSGSSSTGSARSRRKSRTEKRLSITHVSDKSERGTQQQLRKSSGKESIKEHPSILQSPPLEKFRSFRNWLQDATEFIASDGKPGLASHSRDLRRSIYR